MANNVNTNLTQRIFAYISHSDDLNARLAKVYENSLIFVGDEKQIYVPKFGAYVGIGMTSYNNTVGRIDNIAQQLAELKKTMNETAVKKLYVDFGEAAMDGNTQIPGGNIFTPSVEGGMGASITGTPGFVTGEVIITGKANMNEETFFKNDSLYTYNGQTWVNVKNSTDEDAAPTSGIRISYTSDWTQVTLDGGIIAQQPMNQRLVIDDSLTWSYMTHAYAYTLGFTRNYTNNEINKIYQNILGIGSSVLMPVSDESLWDVDPKTGNRRWINTNTLYYKLNADAGLNEYTDNTKWATTTANVTPETVINPDPDAPAHPQYYILVTNYDNSYNMNIADGIQTLQEVAHILDIITDGGVGSITYIPQSEWPSSFSSEDYAANSYVYNGTTYHRVIAQNGKPTTNPNSYGWYIKVDPENLGIQMANSIASNTADISDLHDHVALAEEGQTTLRSLSQYNPSQFITMSQWSNRNGLTVTDTNQSLPGASTYGQTAYMVGDVKTMTSLTVASTYITYNNAQSEALYPTTSLNGEERIGLYQLVDTTKFPEWEDGKYFVWNDTAMVAANSADWPIKSNPDTLYDASDQHNLKKFYTINASSKAEEHINDTFTYASGAFVDEHTTETFYVYKNTGTEEAPAWKYVQASTEEKNNDSIKKYYIATGGTGADYVLHANTTESNRLATTAWTMALVDDRNANLQSELDGILEEANKYTDEKINSLDANYKYRDFASYFNTVDGASGLTYGTSTYINLWNEQYAAWTADKADNTFTGDHADYVAGYTYNRVRSQYITNVIEENGMVTAEGRELPTDELKLSYSIWNTQREGAQFTPITLNGDGNGTNDVAVDGVEGLFGFVYNNGGTPKEIYYQTGDTYEPWTYVNTTDTPISNLVYLGNDGEYKTVDTSSANVTYVIQHSITNSPWWPGQIYKLNTAYYEVNVSSIKTSNVGNDAEYITSFEYMGPEGLTEVTLASASDQPTFFAKNVNNNKEVKYLTGHVDHFSYVGDGEGQNRFYVDAHITHIEDAAHDNTGLADAYDVQNYIQNMFSWVNISASIDSNVLSHEADFYTLVQTKAATSEAVNTLISGKTLYYNNAGTFTAVGTPSIQHFAKNASGKIIVYNANDAVAGSDWYEVSDGASTPQPLEVYECTETVFTNPMNMTLHKI